MAAMRADVQSAEVAVARRALSLFVRMVVAERLVIWYHEPALVENARLQCVPILAGARVYRYAPSSALTPGRAFLKAPFRLTMPARNSSLTASRMPEPQMPIGG